jgi:hypothetical protein
MGDMHQQHIRVVDRVARVGGVFARGIVLEVDARQVALGGAEKFVLVLLELRGVLKHDAVELLPARLVDRQVVHMRSPRYGAAAPGVAWRPARLGQHVEFVRRARQGVQIVAVRVPGEDSEGAHG